MYMYKYLTIVGFYKLADESVPTTAVKVTTCNIHLYHVWIDPLSHKYPCLLTMKIAGAFLNTLSN